MLFLTHLLFLYTVFRSELKAEYPTNKGNVIIQNIDKQKSSQYFDCFSISSTELKCSYLQLKTAGLVEFLLTDGIVSLIQQNHLAST